MKLLILLLFPCMCIGQTKCDSLIHSAVEATKGARFSISLFQTIVKIGASTESQIKLLLLTISDMDAALDDYKEAVQILKHEKKEPFIIPWPLVDGKYGIWPKPW